MKLLTVKDVAGMLKFSQSTIYTWAESGRIPAICLNGSWRFDSDQIQSWILENSRDSSNTEKEKDEQTRPVRTKHVQRDCVESIVDEAIDSVLGTAYTPN